MKFFRPAGRDYRIQHLYSLSLFGILIILLFFVLIIPKIISPPGLSVSLPRVLSSEAVSERGFIITILADDSVYLTASEAHKSESSFKQKAKRVSLNDLRAFLDSFDFKGHQVLIKADKDARMGTVVKVWDLLRQAGVFKVNIATNG